MSLSRGLGTPGRFSGHVVWVSNPPAAEAPQERGVRGHCGLELLKMGPEARLGLVYICIVDVYVSVNDASGREIGAGRPSRRFYY